MAKASQDYASRDVSEQPCHKNLCSQNEAAYNYPETPDTSMSMQLTQV